MNDKVLPRTYEVLPWNCGITWELRMLEIKAGIHHLAITMMTTRHFLGFTWELGITYELQGITWDLGCIWKL